MMFIDCYMCVCVQLKYSVTRTFVLSGKFM